MKELERPSSTDKSGSATVAELVMRFVDRLYADFPTEGLGDLDRTYAEWWNGLTQEQRRVEIRAMADLHVGKETGSDLHMGRGDVSQRKDSSL